MFFNTKKVVTHDSNFHADDCFAVAVLKMKFGKLSVVRTRDEDKIRGADIVVDVGRIYDSSKFRFDHHQEGGAGERENKIPFASFGLVWKEFGKDLTGSVELAEIVDRNLVCAVDANDNGVAISTPIFNDVSIYSVSSVISSMNPTTIEDNLNVDEQFLKAVEVAEGIIKREIAGAVAFIKTRDAFRKTVKESPDKRFVILEKEYSRFIWQQCTDEFPELLFVVGPRENEYAIRAIKKNPGTFENRKDLPLSWAGKSGEEFEKVSGVIGASFCHNKRFVATAKSKDAILKLLDLAINS